MTRPSYAGLALICALALSGCAGAPATPDAELPGGSSSTSEPDTSEGGEAAIDPDILFTISVTATSPTGAVADLTQTVFKPVAATDQQATDEAALDGECDGWRGEFGAPEYLVSLIDVTDRSPDGAFWENSVAVVSMNGWPVFSGEVSSFQAYCASDQVNLGASRGVSPVAANPDGAGGWAQFEYGFGIPTEAGGDTPGPNDTVLSNCVITLGAEALSSSIASAWTSGGTPLSCIFGRD